MLWCPGRDATGLTALLCLLILPAHNMCIFAGSAAAMACSQAAAGPKLQGSAGHV